MLIANEIMLIVVLLMLAGTVVSWGWILWDAVKYMRKHMTDKRNHDTPTP